MVAFQVIRTGALAHGDSACRRVLAGASPVRRLWLQSRGGTGGIGPVFTRNPPLRKAQTRILAHTLH